MEPERDGGEPAPDDGEADGRDRLGLDAPARLDLDAQPQRAAARAAPAPDQLHRGPSAREDEKVAAGERRIACGPEAEDTPGGTACGRRETGARAAREAAGRSARSAWGPAWGDKSEAIAFRFAAAAARARDNDMHGGGGLRGRGSRDRRR